MDDSFVSDVCLNDVISGLQLQDAVAYRRKVEFSNADDYAVYVRENVSVGMKVRCCQTYEEVCEGDVGTVVKVSVVAIVVVIIVRDHNFSRQKWHFLQLGQVNCKIRIYFKLNLL